MLCLCFAGIYIILNFCLCDVHNEMFAAQAVENRWRCGWEQHAELKQMNERASNESEQVEKCI